MADRPSGAPGLDRLVLRLPIRGPGRCHQAGGDRVDPHRPAGLGQQARHLVERGLRHGIGDRAADRAHPGDRRDGDDVAVGALLEVGQRRLGQQPGAGDVDVEGPGEDLVGQRREVVMRHGRGPAGVVHQDVEPAEALDGRRQQPLARRLVADVGLHIKSVGAEFRGDAAAGLHRVRRVDHHRGAKRRQPPRDGLADAAARSRDEGHSVGKFA